MGREFVLQGKVVFKTDVNSIRKAVTQLNNQLAKLGKGTTLKITAPNLGKVSKELTDLNRNVAGFATNINNLSKSIKVTSQGVAKTISNTNKTAQQSLNQTAKAATNAKDAFEAFGKQAAVSARRYVSFAAVTGAFLKLTQAIKANVSEAISFDREVIRLLQVTGKTKAGISDLTKEIDRLSIGLGVSSKDLLDVSVTLAQAGLTARETKTALEAIAKSGVSASFGDMKDTGEAVIAIFQQFGYQASDLEGVLSSVNKVSAAFAVEAGDITTAVRRAGSSFKSAGATFNEFQGLFTSVRQTTRESAESIATGLRTIVSRLQRVRTQNFFKDLGIDLVKEGRFIGPLKAIEAISEATENLSRQDPVFASIAEELGGFRQINKVIPLLDKVAVTRKAINIGLRAENSLTGDSIIAQQALAIQIEKVRQEFQALIREITSSDAFRDVARTFLTISSAVIKTVDALQTLLPLVAGIGVATSSKRIASFTKGFLGFNKGGGVPGFGNGDTVPAMLTPGEFVINKKSAQNYGYNNLKKINKYAKGGVVGKYAEGGEVPNEKRITSIKKFESILNALADAIVKSNPALAGFVKIFRGLTKEEKTHETLGAGVRGRALYKSGTVGLNLQSATVGTAKHELAHLADYNLAKTQGLSSGLASNEEGTLQNLFAKANLPGTIYRAKASGQNDEYIKYVSQLHEVFAHNVEKLTNEQFAILSSITDPREGINKLRAAGLDIEKHFGAKANARFVPGGSGMENLIDNAVNDRNKFDPRTFFIRKPPSRGGGGVAGGSGIPGGVFGGSGGGFGPNNLPSGGASRSGFKFNPTSAGLAGIAVITVLSQFGEGVQKLIPIITTVASAFFLLNTTLKGISKETRPQLKAIARERLDNLNIGKKSAEQARVQSLKSDFYKIKSSELSNKISSTTDPKELARLQRKKNAADISAQQYSTEAVESLGTSQNAFQRRRQLRTNLLNRRVTRNRRILIGAGIGAAATAAAPILSDAANTNALAGQDRTFGLNTTAVAGAGGAVSGAVTGATTGAAIGSLFGPAGVAIGAAAGGVVGALNGLVTSIKDSSDKIQLAKFGESVQELRQKLRLVAEGRLSSGAIGGGILSSIRQTSLLSATANPEQRQNIVATFNENQSEIEDFFYKIAEESQTLDEFNSRTKGLLGTFAVLTKIPFKDLEKSISDTIDKNKIKSNLDAKSIVEQNKLLQNITTMNVTIGAFNSAALAIENTNRRLQQFSSAIDGSINLLESRDFASVIKTGGEGQLFGGNQFGSAVNAVSGFIPNGAASANSILESTKVNQVLPAILKRVSATIPREGEGNFETRLEKELQAVTNNNDVISAILTKVGGVIGTTGEDKKAIERVNEDVLGFSKEISNSFSPLVDLFSEGASRLQDRINATVKAFDDLGKIVNNIKSLELERIGVEEKLDKTLRDRLGIQDPGNAGFNRRRLQTITGGETSVGGLVRQFEDARKAAQNLQLLRDTSLSTNDALISEQKKLALASEAAVKGLEFLARESNDLSDRFARDAEQGRELRSNALTRVVGTAEERISLRRQQSLIGRVRSSGTFAGIPEEDRRGIAEKIELLFPEEFKKIFSADLIRQGFSQEQAQSAVQGKTQNTDSILEEIKKNAEMQYAAITALQQIQSTLASDIQKGITSANAQFTTEVANLSQRIKELSDSIITDKGDREQRLGAISEQTKGISNIFGGAKIGGKNFASLNGAADLLEERGGLLQQKSVTSPEFIKETFNKLTNQIDTSNTEGVLKLVDQLEGLTGTTFTKARAGISDTISSVGGVKIGKNQTAKDFFFTNFEKDINEQIPGRLKGINEKLGVNSSELAFRGLTPVNQDVKSIEESVKLIRSFVSAVEQVGGPSKIPHFASGGVVPGSGNRDSVLAMLTPGEVVLNKNQVKAARSGGGYSIDASSFNDVVVKFSNAAGSLSKSLDQFPREITLSANHKVEVIFNGAEILTRLMPEIQNIAIEECKLAINKMIDQKFPDVGRVR